MATQRDGNQQIPIEEISRSLESGVAGADPLRVEGLTGLQRLRQVKATSLDREQVRLSEKLGADHPRVVALTAKMQANQALDRSLLVELERTQSGSPTADETTWILHGHVLSVKGKGIPNLTIALYDQRGTWVEQLGYACTDKQGHFQFTYRQQTGKANALLGDTTTAATATTQTVSLFVRAFDRRSQLLYTDLRPITPKLGQVDYIKIILPEDTIACKPPQSSDTANNPNNQ